METCNVRRTSEPATHAIPHDDIATGTGSRTEGNDCSFATATNGNGVVHQRRRVNPESLALRLGPELVRDLDALIMPGNTEMPSFAVRKELQERYNIDRRHIYDYFHSRGLRVVKEDKHSDPMVAKDLLIPLPNLRPLRQALVKNTRPRTSYPVPVERRLRGITKAKPGRPRKSPSVDPKIASAGCGDESNESMEANNAPVSERCPGVALTTTYVLVNPLAPPTPLASFPAEEDENYVFNSAVNPLDETFSVRRAIGDVAYAYRHKLVFERMQELTEYPAKLALTDDQLPWWNETSPCSASERGLLLPHAKALTRGERQAIYEAIADGLGPAHGIQECQGTYRKHMQARTKLYFEGLLPAPNLQDSQQPAGTSTLSDRKTSFGSNEFRHWLSETRFFQREGTHGSPRVNAGHRNANVAIVDSVEKRYTQTSVPHWIATLDDLFPWPGVELNGIADSPVAHARHVERTTAHARASGAETQSAQLHGVSGFPGPRIRSDSHPQSPDHLPSVRRTGQRKPQIRDLDRIRIRQVPASDPRRRTPSAAGDI